MAETAAHLLHVTGSGCLDHHADKHRDHHDGDDVELDVIDKQGREAHRHDDGQHRQDGIKAGDTDLVCE